MDYPRFNSYQEAYDFIMEGRNKLSRPLPGTYTTIRYNPDNKQIAIRHHETDIITWIDEENIRLNTDGWQSKTTKERFNAYLPNGYMVYNSQHMWRVQVITNYEAKSYEDKNIYSLPYHDGMVLPATPSEYIDYSTLEDTMVVKVKKVQAYIRDYLKHVADGTLAAQPPNPSIRVSALEMMDEEIAYVPKDVIEELIENKQYPPELLERAVYKFGNSNYLYEIMEKVTTYTKKDISVWNGDEYRRWTRHSLGRFVRKCVGLPL